MNNNDSPRFLTSSVSIQTVRRLDVQGSLRYHVNENGTSRFTRINAMEIKLHDKASINLKSI